MIIHSREDIEKQIKEWGFLPFFADSIPGFSLEKMTPPELWFHEDDLSDMGLCVREVLQEKSLLHQHGLVP